MPPPFQIGVSVSIAASGHGGGAGWPPTDNTPIAAWDDVAGETGYDFELYSNADDYVEAIHTDALAADAASYDIRANVELVPGVFYAWRVRGTNDAGPGGWTELVYFKVTS